MGKYNDFINRLLTHHASCIQKIIDSKRYDVKKTTVSAIYLIYIERDNDIVPNTMYRALNDTIGSF